MQSNPLSSATGRPVALTGQSTQLAALRRRYTPLKTFKHDELPKLLQCALGPHATSPPTYLYGISCSESFLFDYAKKHDIKYANDELGWEIDCVVEAITDIMEKAFNCPFITIKRLEASASERTNPKYGIAAYTNQTMLAPKWLKKIGKTSVEEVISKIQEATGIHDEPMWHPSIGVVPRDVAGL